MTAPGRPLRLLRAGVVSYPDGLELQAELVRRRRAGEVADSLVLLEHPHVITLGSASDPAHVLIDEEERARRGIELFDTGRGGDVTYHGPGQLVAYPVLDLKPDRQDLHRYLRNLEEVLIEAVAELGVVARRSEGATGVWTDRGKLAAIGIRVSSGWITSHGVALNVDVDLSFFDTIVPCGIHGQGVTSLALELGAAPEMSEASRALVRAFRSVFGYSIPVA